MAPLMRFEKVLSPIGPNDAQIHRGSMADEMDIMLVDAMAEARRDHLGKRYNGYTYEIVPDGAGVKHYNLTVHLKDDGPQLNPHNLNDAPQTLFGQTLSADELQRRGIGAAERNIRSVPINTPDAPTFTSTSDLGGDLGKLQAPVPSAVDGRR